jgi:hypothetical protein
MRDQGAASGPHPGWAPPWAAGSLGGPEAGGPVGRRPGPADDRLPAGVDRPTLVIDVGPATAAAMVVTELGAWLVPDPASGEGRWPWAVHGDGERTVAGAAALQRAQVDPGGYRAGLWRALVDDDVVVLGTRTLRSVEVVAEFLAAVRSAAARLLPSLGGPVAPPDWAVVTVPPAATDALRRRLIGAAEVAGFTGVELLPQAAAAVWAPGLPLRAGDLALVCDVLGPDTGPAVAATLVRVTEGLPEILGHGFPADANGSVNGPPPVNGRSPAGGTSPVDGAGPGDIQPNGQDGPAAPGGIDRALADCRDLLGRLGISRTQVSWVVVVGGGARTPGLAARVEHGLGIPVATVDEPELAAIRGAAAWLPRSGPRRVRARGSTQRLVPLAYTLPGHTARLLRWLVEPRQPYAEGAAVARVRLANGAVWDLTVRTPGVLDEVLVPAGRDVRSGEWLALVRPA